jgi:hypothetical protein
MTDIYKQRARTMVAETFARGWKPEPRVDELRFVGTLKDGETVISVVKKGDEYVAVTHSDDNEVMTARLRELSKPTIRDLLAGLD